MGSAAVRGPWGRAETRVNRPSGRTYLTNATLILPGETVEDGSLLLEEGRIVAICPEGRGARDSGLREIELDGDFLMPGIIDLHSDALEHELEPRPGALLSPTFAVMQGDRKAAMAGITTAYHALYFGGYGNGRRNIEVVADLARCMHSLSDQTVVDNRVHCRFEMTYDEGITVIRDLLREGICTFVALNNHAVGQGQTRDVDDFRAKMKQDYRLSEAEIDHIIEESVARNVGAEERAAVIAAETLKAGTPLASHDDDSAEMVDLRYAQGVTVAEFPVTMAAAHRVHELGLHALVGAPNVLRGGSTGTGLRAIEAIAEGWADCLCSDYVPAAILPAVFQVARELDWPLHRAAYLCGRQPAHVARLEDRGTITVGLRADLIAVRERAGLPIVRHLWAHGCDAMQF